MPETTDSAINSRDTRFFLRNRTRAGRAVQNAIADGRLVVPTACSNCGKTKKVDAHHDDYSRQLDVRWLCRKCHAGWHAENGPGRNGEPERIARHCRHYARIDRENTGQVYRTQELKSGKVSIVLHVDKATLTAGDTIKWGKVD